jgi:ubiquitin carboxyl-terminal hydrolase L5
MKGVVKDKLSQGGDAYDKWVEESKAKTRKRAQDQKAG